MIHKVASIEISKTDSEQGVIEAFVNTMGVKDSDGDIIDPSAFNKSINNNLPIPVLVGHDQHQIVGKVVDAVPVQVDDEVWKLDATIQMNMDTPAGRDAFSNVKGAFIQEWSVGFNIPDGGSIVESRGDSGTRRIKELDWVETSAVVRGASPDTATIAAKDFSEEETDGVPAVEDEPNSTDADNADTETATVETPENAESDVEETFDADAADAELLANAERQLNLLRMILNQRISVQEETP